jgi:hypothetical protein
MTENNTSNENLKDYSSRIKSILIEVPGYKYFHATSKRGAPNPNFIGRNSVKKRIKAIFTESDTRSGCYLITGLRGHGKTSLIGEVLNDMSGYIRLKRAKSVCLYYIITILFLRLFSVDHFITNYIKGFALILSVLILITFFTDFFIRWSRTSNYLKKVNRRKKNRILRGVVFLLKHSLYDILFINKEKVKHHWYYVIINICILLLVGAVLNISKFCDYKLCSLINVVYSIIVYAFLVICILLFKYIGRRFINIVKNNSKNKDKNKLSLNYRNIWNYRLVKNIRYRKNVFVRINFNQKSINEKDFFNMLARAIYTEYKGFSYSRLKNLIINGTVFMILMFSLSFFLFFVLNFDDVMKSILISDKPSVSQNINVKYNVSSDRANIETVIPQNLENNENKNVIRKQEFFIAKYFPTQLFNSESEYTVEFRDDMILFYEKNSSLKDISVVLIVEFRDDMILFYEENNSSKGSSVALIVCKDNVNMIRLIDVYIQYSYIYVREHLSSLPVLGCIVKNGTGSYLNYGYLLFTILLSIISYFLLRSKFLGFVTPIYIIYRLKKLNRRIISSEEQTGSGGKFGFLFSRKRSFPIIELKELEVELIDILKEASKSNYILPTPDFIFIIDELDKIVYDKYDNVSKNSEDTALISNYTNNTPSSVRQRRQKMFDIFSNLKYFLTTAEAKFVFIAGREMYDASIADVSSRDFFINSIFNQVINIDSFLSDFYSDIEDDISSSTEKYLIKLLLPEPYNREEKYSLNVYNKYLKDYFQIEEEEKSGDKEKDDSKLNTSDLISIINKGKRDKVITVLRHFIIYLTHISGGTPKKIVRYIEEHMTTHDHYSFKTKNYENTLTIYSDKKSKLFLTFNFNTQYKIGVVNHVVNPFLHGISDVFKEYDDKLLVSATFIVNHLLKFHRTAFNWRILEQAPDILDINRTPELRRFVRYIVHHLSDMQLYKLNSGIFEYKFTPKTTAEISYLSKIKIDAAAIFNFSLDSNFPIKDYYQESIDLLQNRKLEQDSWFSLARTYDILGDLHYYDEEYNQAIIEYKNSLGYLDKIIDDSDKKNMSPHKIVSYSRIKSKLCLAYEKSGALHSAYNNSIENTQKIVEYFVTETNMSKTTDIIINNINEIDSTINTDYNDIIRRDILENTSILYQPIINTLFLKEKKEQLGGIQYRDILRAEKEFMFLQKHNESGNVLFKVDFYLKMGDVLFFKNRYQMNQLCCPFEKYSDRSCNRGKSDTGRCHCQALYYYYKAFEVLISEICNEQEYCNKDSLSRFESLINEINSKRKRGSIHLDQGSVLYNVFAQCLDRIGDSLIACSSGVNKISINGIFDILKLKLETTIPFENNTDNINVDFSEYDINNFVVLFYRMASYFFYKADESKESVNVNIKIGHTLIYWLKPIKGVSSDVANDFFELYEKQISIPTIKKLFVAFDNIHYNEIHKLKRVLNNKQNMPNKLKTFDKSKLFEEINLNNLFIHTDIIEPIYQYYKLALTLRCDEVDNYIKKIYKHNYLGAYNTHDSVYNRILQLELKESINKYIIQKHIVDEIELSNKLINQNNNVYNKDFTTINKTDYPFFFCVQILYLMYRSFSTKNKKGLFFDLSKIMSAKSDWEFMIFLIYDSIRSLEEIISVFKLMGETPFFSDRFIAGIYERVAYWTQLEKAIEYIIDEEDNLENFFSEGRMQRIDEKIASSFDIKKEILDNRNLSSPGKEINSNMLHEICKEIWNSFHWEENNDIELIKTAKSNLESLRTKSITSAEHNSGEAINHYYTAIEGITEGKAYKHKLESLFFLNDDLSDSNLRFNNALTCYFFHTEYIHTRLKKLKNQFSYSSSHEIDNWITKKN